MADTEAAGRILLTGATGYVGGRLLARLQKRGLPLRCLARDPGALRGQLGPGEAVRGDLLEPASLAPAFDGVASAYYLVHSMGAGEGYEARDRRCAEHFATAAREAGVGRIIYLGGLGEDGGELSPHLRSRQEVGRILRDSGVPTVELRAAIVIGAGSLSFEMVAALVERLPVMVTPRWVRVRTQPIAIDDLIDYLVGALTIEAHGSPVFEVGGADVVSYGELMEEYARQRGLRRLMFPVPVLTPRLSSLWLGLVTPLYARVGRELIEGVRNPTVVRDGRAPREFGIEPMDTSEAIARALRQKGPGAHSMS